MTAQLSKLWINALHNLNGTHLELRADFDNDWHAAAVVDRPYSPRDVARALVRLADVIANSPGLQEPQRVPTARDIMSYDWDYLVPHMLAKWSELTPDDLSCRGNREYLIGKLQERYGIDHASARSRVTDFEQRLDDLYPKENQQ